MNVTERNRDARGQDGGKQGRFMIMCSRFPAFSSFRPYAGLFLSLPALLLSCFPVPLPAWAADAAAQAAPPVVVETFTSRFCPNCPAGEASLNGYADGRHDFMVVLEHVDYWDNPAENHIDPLGSPDFTQRQYDYSNRLGRRPGEVFTPQPILDGNSVASPPFFLNWAGTLDKALAANHKGTLTLAKNGDGWLVSLPAGTPAKNLELALFSLEKGAHHPNLWEARGLTRHEVNGTTTHLRAAELPKGGSHLLVLLEEPGGGRITASALISR
jgi:hypothetical protein